MASNEIKPTGRPDFNESDYDMGADGVRPRPVNAHRRLVRDGMHVVVSNGDVRPAWVALLQAIKPGLGQTVEWHSPASITVHWAHGDSTDYALMDEVTE